MILLMGIAGSGKGTQGALLAETQGYKILSTGELLRKYGSDEQHERIEQGIYMADEEITELLDKALRSLPDQDNVILDGYPRTLGQSKWLLNPEQQKRFKITYILHLVTSRDAAKERINIRARSDDNDGAIEKRFNEYEKGTLPMLNYYREIGIEVIEVNGEQSIEDVQAEILAIDKARNNVHAG